MFNSIKKIANKALSLTRYKSFGTTPPKISFPVELTDEDTNIINYVVDNDLTMTSNERLFATLMACKYVSEQNIEGDFVECGVWRGGNSMLAADVFRRMAPHKKAYLFDTFKGMTAPSRL